MPTEGMVRKVNEQSGNHRGRIADEDDFWRAHRTSDDDFRLPSLARGFDQMCRVQSYAIKNKVVCVLSHPNDSRSFYPILKNGIVCSLAKIRVGDTKAVLKFYNDEYGLLGHDQLVKEKHFAGGDPLRWIWAHARTLRLCLGLMYCVERDLQSDLKTIFVNLNREKRFLVGALGHVVPVSRFVPGKIQGDFPSVARFLYRTIINCNIQGVNRTLTPDHESDSRQVSFYRYRALIQMAYWHLADAAEENTVERCRAPHCQSFFIQGHGSNSYCPPSFDERKGGDEKPRKIESPCALLARADEWNYVHHDKPKRSYRYSGTMWDFIIMRKE